MIYGHVYVSVKLSASEIAMIRRSVGRDHPLSGGPFQSKEMHDLATRLCNGEERAKKLEARRSANNT